MITQFDKIHFEYFNLPNQEEIQNKIINAAIQSIKIIDNAISKHFDNHIETDHKTISKITKNNTAKKQKVGVTKSVCTLNNVHNINVHNFSAEVMILIKKI